MLTGAIANLLINGLIIVLLAVTIGYCWILNNRIKILQDSRSELALLLKHFDESTKRASESIMGLQAASKKIGESIQQKIEKANFVLDDISFMMEKGEKLANKLEASLAVSRARNKVMAEQPAPEARPRQQVTEITQDTEEELREKIAPLFDKSISSREKATASLEAVLERVVKRQNMQYDDAELLQEAPPVKSRSRSEEELLALIRAGIKG